MMTIVTAVSSSETMKTMISNMEMMTIVTNVSRSETMMTMKTTISYNETTILTIVSSSERMM